MPRKSRYIITDPLAKEIMGFEDTADDSLSLKIKVNKLAKHIKNLNKRISIIESIILNGRRDG